MSEAKWVVKKEWTTEEDCEEMLEEYGHDPDDYEMDDFQEIEISVVRNNNIHGLRSYGWAGVDKIILFSDESFDEEVTQETIDWCVKVAEAVAKTLNKKGL